MTPTLSGRWQTRILLSLTVGAMITCCFGLLALWLNNHLLACFLPFIILLFVMIAGLVWDALYIFLQGFRWDRDWPPLFQWLSAIIEMFPAFLLAFILGIPWWLFLWHYWTIWLVIFIMAQGPMRIIFPRWRYNGGQWL